LLLLRALYIIILVYTTCYSKNIKPKIAQITVGLKLRNSSWKFPGFNGYQFINYFIGEHRVFLWDPEFPKAFGIRDCGFILLPSYL